MFMSVIRLVLTVSLGLALCGASFAETDPRPSPVPIHGLPEIISIDLPADRDFHAGQTIRGSVVTSTNVGYVEARVNYRNTPLHRDGLGKFSLVYTIPWWLPPWLRHGWTLQIIARSIDGVEVKEYFPIRIH
jgi:hypothetical protein